MRACFMFQKWEEHTQIYYFIKKTQTMVFMASIQFQIITRNTTRGNVKSQGGEGEEGERGGSKDQIEIN